MRSQVAPDVQQVQARLKLPAVFHRKFLFVEIDLATGDGIITEKRTVRPGGRQKNATYRTREHLTEAEVDRLLTTAKANRWGHRDATMILVAFRHGFRASELVDLRWDQIDFNAANLHVRRVKKGSSATHPILGDELRALRRLQREQEPKSPFVLARRSPGRPLAGL